jgi:DNA-binding NarL/FixJ family response regulator
VADEITCLIADDHEVVREGLRLALSRSPRIRVIGEAGDGASAVALTERRRPDVVIMDLRMPDMDGLEATETLLERVPGTAVLIFTAYGERSLLQRGLESGARGYILKETPHETLLRAIEKVAAGETFVDPGLMAEFVAGRGQDILTPREREILQLLADGMSNVDVAQKLFISQETVKSHVRHILAKLEADTRTQAVAIALREAMID